MSIKNIHDSGVNALYEPNLKSAAVSQRQVKTGGVSTDTPAGQTAQPSGSLSAGMMGLAAPKISGADLMSMMQSLQAKVQDTRLRTSSEDVKNIQQQKAAVAKERIAKLNENIKKIQEAKTTSKIGQLFGWIAAIATTVAGVALLAAGGAGAGLIVAGAAMMATMALQQTGLMDNIVGGIAQLCQDMGMDRQAAQIVATAVVGAAIIAVAVAAGAAGGPAAAVGVGSQFLSTLFSPDNLEKMGVSHDAAPWVSMGVSIGLALVSIGSAAGAVKSGANAAGKLGELSSKIAAKITEVGAEGFAKGARITGLVATGVTALATGTGGVTTIATSVNTEQAEEQRADAKELQKDLLKLQQMFQDEEDRIKKIMQAMQESTNVVMSVLNQQDTTNKRITTI